MNNTVCYINYNNISDKSQLFLTNPIITLKIVNHSYNNIQKLTTSQILNNITIINNIYNKKWVKSYE